MTQTSPPEPSRKNHLTRYLLWALCACWAGVIFSFSAKPGSQIPGGYSEIGHLGEYFVFGLLLYSALRASGFERRAAALALIVASLYGITDEFHQHFVVMRTPDVVDWGSDTVGAACGIAAALAARTLMRRRRGEADSSESG